MSEPIPQALAPELADQINAAHDQAEAALRTGLEHARKAGELLLAAKEQCRHGGWSPWLEAHVHCSEHTAQAYMRVACRRQEIEAKRLGHADSTIEDGVQLLADSKSVADAPPVAPKAALEARQQNIRKGLAALQQVLDDPDAPLDVLAQLQVVAGQYMNYAAEQRIRAERALGQMRSDHASASTEALSPPPLPPLAAGRWYQGVATDADGKDVLVEIAPHPDRPDHWVWSFVYHGGDGYRTYQERGSRLSPCLLAEILRMHKLTPQLWNEHEVKDGFEPLAFGMDCEDKKERRGRWSWMKEKVPTSDDNLDVGGEG